MKNIQSRTDPARVGSEDRHYRQPSKKIEIWTVGDSHYNAKNQSEMSLGKKGSRMKEENPIPQFSGDVE